MVDIPVTFSSNYRNFLGSCLLFQLIRIIDVLQMHTYIIRGTVEQHTHRFLGTPHRFVLIEHLYPLFLSFYLKDKELSLPFPLAIPGFFRLVAGSQKPFLV